LWLGLAATLLVAKTPLEAAILGGLWAFVGCMIPTALTTDLHAPTSAFRLM
jgi:hypothetical protein